jgi:DNA polymerase III subunit alpha
VAFAIRITDIDPMPYNLLFERFLNPERVSMPDIDVDFCINGREKVIDYVREEYGAENVAQIITFGTMQAKGVIRDVGRAWGCPMAMSTRSPSWSRGSQHHPEGCDEAGAQAAGADR